MDILDRLNVVLGMMAVAIVGWHLLRILLGARRVLQTGCPSSLVGAYITTGLIGLGVCLAGAAAGGLAVRTWVTPPANVPLFWVLAQLAGALTVSWVVAHVYVRVLSRPIQTWFAAEEALKHDG